MSKHYDNLLVFVAMYAPKHMCEGLLADLDSLQAEAATARELALDEVDAELRDLKTYLHIMSDSDGLFMDFRARVDKLRAPPTDPELARLEREVARAAVAAMREAADTDEWGVYSKSERIRLTSDSEKLARSAMFNHLIAKRKGGTK